MDFFFRKIVLVGLVSTLIPGAAYAIPLPSTILPERQSPINPAPNGGIEAPPPPIQQQGPGGQKMDESALKVKFHLKKIVLEGNTVYTYAELEPIFKSSIDKEISLADLQLIASEIEKYYVEHGYILTRVIIPPQEIDSSGVAKIQVVEGYVSQVVIDGKTNKVKALIEAFTQPVLESHPLQISKLERAVLLINDIPGVATKAVLTPSFDTPGASTLVLVVDQRFFTGNVTLDDRGTRYVGPEQISTTLQFNNLLSGPGQLEFDGKVTGNTSELRSGNLQYTGEVFNNGSTLMGGFTLNQVLPGSTLTPLHIDGLSETTSMIYTYPFIRSRRMNLSGTATYDYLNSKTYFSTLLVTLDRIESIRAGATFNYTDDLQGVNLMTAQFSQGIEMFSGPEQPELKRSTVNGQKNYSKVNMTYTRLQSLPDTWSLFLSATGQLAFNSLLSAEQIGYGGVQYGSAYDTSEIIADSGIEGKTEIRYNSTLVGNFFRSTQYYLSWDFGALYQNNPVVASFAKQSGTSAAIGLRYDVLDRVNGSVEIAKPLTRNVAAYHNKDPRFFFSITVDLGH